MGLPAARLLALSLALAAASAVTNDAPRWSRSSSDWVPVPRAVEPAPRALEAPGSRTPESLIAAESSHVGSLLTPPLPQALAFAQPPTFLPHKPFREPPRQLLAQPTQHQFVAQREFPQFPPLRTQQFGSNSQRFHDVRPSPQATPQHQLFSYENTNEQQFHGQDNVDPATNSINQFQSNPFQSSQFQRYLNDVQAQTAAPQRQPVQHTSPASIGSDEQKPDVQLVYVPVETLRQRQAALTSTTTTNAPATTSKPVPHQPPLSVYMGKEGHLVNIADVIKVLKDAKSIAVLNSVGPDTPQVFVGPSNLNPPDSYAKFELPYLSSIESNRVERKVDQLPFFVAPLNFKPPAGYSKIPFPAPHIGSVVISNQTDALNSQVTPSAQTLDEYLVEASRGQHRQHRFQEPAATGANSVQQGDVFLTPNHEQNRQTNHLAEQEQQLPFVRQETPFHQQNHQQNHQQSQQQNHEQNQQQQLPFVRQESQFHQQPQEQQVDATAAPQEPFQQLPRFHQNQPFHQNQFHQNQQFQPSQPFHQNQQFQQTPTPFPEHFQSSTPFPSQSHFQQPAQFSQSPQFPHNQFQPSPPAPHFFQHVTQPAPPAQEFTPGSFITQSPRFPSHFSTQSVTEATPEVSQEAVEQPQEEEEVTTQAPRRPTQRTRPRTTQAPPVEEEPSTTTRRPFQRSRRPVHPRTQEAAQPDANAEEPQRINSPRPRIRNSHRVVGHRLPAFQKSEGQQEQAQHQQQEQHVARTPTHRARPQQAYTTEPTTTVEVTSEEIQYQTQPQPQDGDFSVDQGLTLGFQNALLHSPTRGPLTDYQQPPQRVAAESPLPQQEQPLEAQQEYEPQQEVRQHQAQQQQVQQEVQPEAPPAPTSTHRAEFHRQRSQFAAPARAQQLDGMPRFEVPVKVSVQRQTEAPLPEDTPRPVYVRTRGQVRPPPVQRPAEVAAEEPEEEYGFLRPMNFAPSAPVAPQAPQAPQAAPVEQLPVEPEEVKVVEEIPTTTPGRRKHFRGRTRAHVESTTPTTTTTSAVRRRPVDRQQVRLTSVRGRVRRPSTSTETSETSETSTTERTVRRRPASRYSTTQSSAEEGATSRKYESPRGRGSASFRRPAGQDSSTASSFRVTVPDEPENYPPGFDLASHNSAPRPSYALSTDLEGGSESQWSSKRLHYVAVESAVTPDVYFTSPVVTTTPSSSEVVTEVPEVVVAQQVVSELTTIVEEPRSSTEKPVENVTEIDVPTTVAPAEEVTTLAQEVVDEHVVPKESKTEIKKAADYHFQKKNPSGRRGQWVRVRKVVRPGDVLETAESQNVGALSKNQLSKGKPSQESWSLPLAHEELDDVVFDVPKISAGDSYSTLGQAALPEVFEENYSILGQPAEPEVFQESYVEPEIFRETTSTTTTTTTTTTAKPEIVTETVFVDETTIGATQAPEVFRPSSPESTTDAPEVTTESIVEEPTTRYPEAVPIKTVNVTAQAAASDHDMIQSSVRDAIQQNSQSEEHETSTNAPREEFDTTTDSGPESTETERSVRISESTEVSHETEICYRGRCIKTKTADTDNLAVPFE